MSNEITDNYHSQKNQQIPKISNKTMMTSINYGHDNGQQSQYQSNNTSNTDNNQQSNHHNNHRPDDNNNDNNDNNNDNSNNSGNNGNGNGGNGDDDKNDKNGDKYDGIKEDDDDNDDDDEEEEEEEQIEEEEEEKYNIGDALQQNFYFGDAVSVPMALNIATTKMNDDHNEDHDILYDLAEITTDLSLEKEISDILEMNSKSISNAKETTVFDEQLITNKSVKKRKAKKRKKGKKQDKDSGVSYNPNALYRAQGNIQISKQLTITIIPEMIKENISNVYPFMDKSTALCISMEERKQNHYQYNGQTVRIFNYGFHDKITHDTLYCIVQRQNMDINAARGYKWKMVNKLYTIKEIEGLLGISSDTLPESLRETDRFKTYLMMESKIGDILRNKEQRKILIDTTPWHKIDIFNKINNKRRMTLSLTKPEFMRRCTVFAANNMNDTDTNTNDMVIQLIPILMFNNTEINEYWVEYLWIVHIEQGIDVGVAFKLNAKKEVKVCGIHLDKEYLQIQHELVLPQHTECHCFDGFESNINYLAIGNPDDHINKIKYYQQQIQELKQYKEYITCLLDIAPNNISKLQSLQKEIAAKTDTKLPKIPSLTCSKSKPLMSNKNKKSISIPTSIRNGKHRIVSQLSYNRNGADFRKRSQNMHTQQTAINIPMTSMQQQPVQQMMNAVQTQRRPQQIQQIHHIHQLQQLQQMHHPQIQQLQSSHSYTIPYNETIHSTNSLTPHTPMYGLSAITPSNISPNSSYNTITPSFNTNNTNNANIRFPTHH